MNLMANAGDLMLPSHAYGWIPVVPVCQGSHAVRLVLTAYKSISIRLPRFTTRRLQRCRGG